jgi:hypothetical protein
MEPNKYKNDAGLRQKKLLSVQTLKIHTAIQEVMGWRGVLTGDFELLVRMEDARLRTWLPKEESNSEYRGKLMGAGSIKRDCQIWEDLLGDLGVDLELVKPAPYKTKWTPQYFKTVTGWTERTSNHARDAAVLCFGL